MYKNSEVAESKTVAKWARIHVGVESRRRAGAPRMRTQQQQLSESNSDFPKERGVQGHAGAVSSSYSCKGRKGSTEPAAKCPDSDGLGEASDL